MRMKVVACGAVSVAIFCARGFGVTWTGGNAELPGTTVAARPELAGTVIAFQTFNLLPGGSFDDWVVREAGTGTLDFYVRDNGSPGPFLVTGFDVGPGLDVDYRTDLGGSSGGYGSTFAIFTTRLDPLLLFYPPSQAHGSSGIWNLGTGSLYPVVIHTDARDFQSTGSIVSSDQGPAVTITAFVPVVAVPEPQAAGLLLLGLAGLAMRVSRRKLPRRALDC